jgi:hypothetical protein
MTDLLKLSNSSLKTLLRCEQQYRYKFVDNLQPKRHALPLKLGSWIHSLLEARYKDGDWRTTQEKMKRQYDKMFQEERDFYGDLPALTTTIMRGYDYHWRNDEQDWDIVDTELAVELPLSKSWKYVAKLDVVADNEEGRWVWDHKTFKGKAPSTDYRTADPQSALYVWVYERLFGVKPVGFVFNYLRTKLPTVPRLLKNGTLSRAKNIDTNWITLARAIKRYGLDPRAHRDLLAAARARDNLFYDRVFIPKPDAVIRSLLQDIQEKAPRIRELHEGSRPVRTLTMDCQRYCPYHVLCMTELTGGDGSYIRRHEFETREGWEYYDDATVIEETA